MILMVITTQAADVSAKLTPLSEIANSYDGLLCDIWGVIHNGVAAFEDAIDALCRFRATGRFIILVTNAPRSSREIYPQLARFGVPRDVFDTIITSGDVTATLIAPCPELPLFHFGPARDQTILDGLANPIVGLPDAKLCLLTGPLDDTITTVEVYESELNRMRDAAVHMICANPDLVVRSGNRMVICAGAIAQRYIQLGGTVTFAGKPTAAIYDEALRQATILAGRDIHKNQLLAIGDGLLTDIKGAADNGFDACFISGGIHADEFGDMGMVENVLEAATRIQNQNAALNLVALCDRLRWN